MVNLNPSLVFDRPGITDLDESPSSGPLLDDCSICYSNLRAVDASTLKCSHYFHLDCISRNMASDLRCPICRRSIDLKLCENPLKTAFFKQLTNLDPTNPNWHNQYALYALKDNRCDRGEVFKSLIQAVNLDPGNPVHWRNVFSQWPLKLDATTLANPLKNNEMTLLSRLDALSILKQLEEIDLKL